MGFLSSLGIELELAVLLGMVVVGTEVFAAFEVETPVWKKITKWVIVIAITLGLFPLVGHWSAVVAVTFGLLGLSVHFRWCAKHRIHPFSATPRRRYYDLRGWTWPED